MCGYLTFDPGMYTCLLYRTSVINNYYLKNDTATYFDFVNVVLKLYLSALNRIPKLSIIQITPDFKTTFSIQKISEYVNTNNGNHSTDKITKYWNYMISLISHFHYFCTISRLVFVHILYYWLFTKYHLL